MEMTNKIQIPGLSNFSGIGIVLIISWWIKFELEPIHSEVVYLSLWIGIGFGVVLQRSRFCFYCLSRDFIEKKDARGLLGIVVSLIIGTVGYHLRDGEHDVTDFDWEQYIKFADLHFESN